MPSTGPTRENARTRSPRDWSALDWSALATAARREQRAWTAVAERAAAEGDGWTAVHAAAASDVEAMRVVLLERVVPVGPDPAARYAEAASALTRAVSAAALAGDPLPDARAAVDAQREHLLASLVPTLRRDAAAAMAPLDALAGLSVPDRAPAVPDDAAEALGLVADSGVNTLAAAWLAGLRRRADRLGDTGAVVALHVARARAELAAGADPAVVLAG